MRAYGTPSRCYDMKTNNDIEAEAVNGKMDSI